MPVRRYIFVIALFAMMWVSLPQSEAAVGDLLFEWGGENFGVLTSIAVNAGGNVYVTEPGYSRIKVFDSAGNYLFKWGSYGDDIYEFRFPTGIAMDGDGNVYVADTYNNMIKVYKLGIGFVFMCGSKGFEDGQFSDLQDVAMGPDGRVYVLDGRRVQVFEGYGYTGGLSTDAGPDQNLGCSWPGASVTLDGSGTTGDIVSYTWTGPGVNATGVSPTVVCPRRRKPRHNPYGRRRTRPYRHRLGGGLRSR